MYASQRKNVTRSRNIRQGLYIRQGLWRRISHWLLPDPCLACGEPRSDGATRGDGAGLGLCTLCRSRLVRWPERGCAACGRPLAAESLPPGYRCGDCRRRPPPLEGVYCAWVYREPLDAVIAGLKFRRLEYLGEEIGLRLVELLGPRLSSVDPLSGDSPPFDAVVPVPLAWGRRLARGFNQSAVIAKPVARALGLPLLSLLRRRATPPQSRLARSQRMTNVAEAFRARRPARCHGRRLLLVDDVVTTGSTIRAAAGCLRRAGASAVVALAAARAPEG